MLLARLQTWSWPPEYFHLLLKEAEPGELNFPLWLLLKCTISISVIYIWICIKLKSSHPPEVAEFKECGKHISFFNEQKLSLKITRLKSLPVKWDFQMFLWSHSVFQTILKGQGGKKNKVLFGFVSLDFSQNEWKYQTFSPFFSVFFGNWKEKKK